MEDRFYSVLAKQSIFKCLTPLAWNKSGSTGVLILPYWSLIDLGLLPFENQIKSIGIILDVIYLRSWDREILKGLAQKFGSLT